MTVSKGFKRFGFKEEKLEDVKKILGHVALYVGLIVLVFVGGWVSETNFIGKMQR